MSACIRQRVFVHKLAKDNMLSGGTYKAAAYWRPKSVSFLRKQPPPLAPSTPMLIASSVRPSQAGALELLVCPAAVCQVALQTWCKSSSHCCRSRGTRTTRPSLCGPAEMSRALEKPTQTWPSSTDSLIPLVPHTTRCSACSSYVCKH